MRDIPFLPDQFYLSRWEDPVVEQLGFPVNSLYTEATRSKWIFELSECSMPVGVSDGG
jgi:hypothetical protein